MDEQKDIDQTQTTESRVSERRIIYDASAGFYAATFPLIWRFGFPALHRWLASELHDCRAILDAGTGTGYWARYLASVNKRGLIVGLDFSHEYIIRAQKSIPECSVQLVEGDVNAEPFKDQSFDGILCSGVLDTFPDVRPALYEFWRLLVDGGKLVLILRGKRGVLSRIDEFIFRFSVGTTRVIKNRSLASFHVSEALWARDPLWRRLPSLAEETGFRPVYIRSSRIITTAILIRDS